MKRTKPHKSKSKGKTCFIHKNGGGCIDKFMDQLDNINRADHLRDKNNQKQTQGKKNDKNNNNQLRTAQLKK